MVQLQNGSQTVSITQLPPEKRMELHDLYQQTVQYNPHGWHLSWNENRSIYFDETRLFLIRARATGLLRPAIDAMQTASGLARDQAKTCVYYAVATFLLDKYSELFPILLFQGNSGTGKSQAMYQLEKLVKEPKRIQGRTYSQIGRNLDRAVTAIFDEGDFKQERIETDLLQLRCSIGNASQIIHIPPEQRPLNIYNFGATVMGRRQPFTDTATRNRTMIIKTKRIPGEYRLTEISNHEINIMADIIRSHRTEVEASDRVSDAWKPITEIAKTIGDTEWLAYQDGELRRAQQMLAAGDEYEPEDVLIKAILTCAAGAFNQNIKLNQIKDMLERFDVKWTTQKIHTMVIGLGFRTRFYKGYDWMAANNDLLTTLSSERNIRWEEPLS